MGYDTAHNLAQPPLDHRTIEEQSLVERYHRGDLPSELEEAFEEHFFACARCQEELELARDFRRGIRDMAAEEAARTVVGAGLLAWLAHRGRWVQAGLLAAAVLVLAGLPSVWLLSRSRGLEQAVAEARADSDRWRREAEAERGSTAALKERLGTLEARWQEERAALEARLQEVAASAGRRLANLARPLANTPVFLLSVLRGEGDEPAAVIDLAQVGETFALAVDAGADPRLVSYRVTILDAAGDTVFRRGGLRPNSLEAVLITFPGDYFPPGDYRLLLQGVITDGERVELGGYSFRVVEGP